MKKIIVKVLESKDIKLLICLQIILKIQQKTKMKECFVMTHLIQCMKSLKNLLCVWHLSEYSEFIYQATKE